MSVNSPRKVERSKCPVCGCGDTISPKELTIRGYDLDYRIERCSNLSEHKEMGVLRDFHSGVYNEVLDCIKMFRTMNGGEYGGDFSLKWGLDIKEEMPLLCELISEEYEKRLGDGGFNELKERKGVNSNPLSFPENFDLIRSEIDVVENDRHLNKTLLVDLSFSVEGPYGASFRWSGYVTPENEIHSHYYTKLKID